MTKSEYRGSDTERKEEKNAPSSGSAQGNGNGNGNGHGHGRPEIDYSDPAFDPAYDITFAPSVQNAYNSPPLATAQIQGETAADIARLVDETVDALVAQNIPIFKRGFGLVMPMWQERPIKKDQMTKVAALITLDESILEYTLNKYKNTRPVEFLKMKKVMLPSLENNPRSDMRLVACGAPYKVIKTLLNIKH
jgi:hypothetical protein